LTVSLIIVDTREKCPYSFFTEDTKVSKLSCGDYSSKLLLDKLRIERKSSTAEVCMNLGRQKNKDRFHRELEKLSKFPHAIVLCDFPESYVYEFPENSGIPQLRRPSKYEIASGKRKQGEWIDTWAELRVSGKRLRSLLYEVGDIVPVVFSGSRENGEKYALSLIKQLESRYAS
jgi:hypothetical protein